MIAEESTAWPWLPWTDLDGWFRVRHEMEYGLDARYFGVSFVRSALRRHHHDLLTFGFVVRLHREFHVAFVT